MKIGFYNDFRPCLLTDRGVVDTTSVVRNFEGGSPQLTLENIIINWQFLRPKLERLQERGKAIPRSEVRLRPPVPRPGKVINGRTTFKDGVTIDPPRNMKTFLKSPDAVIGDGDTVVLPSYQMRIVNYEAELCLVIGRHAKNVSIAEAGDYIFGYTAGDDVSARAPIEGEAELPGDSDYGKCFDTFLPLGPAITTADEILNPHDLHVRYWINGRLYQDYNTSDIEHGIPFLVATLSHVMSLKPGDLVMIGTNHDNLGPLQDGDKIDLDIEKIGRISYNVSDELRREWDRNDLRTPENNRARREALRSQPNPGTWPFMPRR